MVEPALVPPEEDKAIMTSNVREYRMLNNQNLKRELERPRSVKVGNSDFGSDLLKHDRDHHRL